MKNIPLIVCLLLAITSHLILAQTVQPQVNAPYSNIPSTPNVDSTTTTAVEYCKFLNTVDFEQWWVIRTDYYYQSTAVLGAIDRYDNLDARYYIVKKGHDNDAINLSVLSSVAQRQFQRYEAANQNGPNVNVLCAYLNYKIDALNAWWFDTSDRDAALAIRRLYSDVSSQQLFDKADKIARIVSNWNYPYDSSNDDEIFYGPDVNFLSNEVETNSNSFLFCGSPSYAYVVWNNVPIICFKESDGDIATAYVNEQGGSYPSADLLMEYQSVDSFFTTSFTQVP